jgi:hypothetical protein
LAPRTATTWLLWSCRRDRSQLSFRPQCGSAVHRGSWSCSGDRVVLLPSQLLLPSPSSPSWPLQNEMHLRAIRGDTSSWSWVTFCYPLIRVARGIIACDPVPIWSIERCTYNGDLVGTFSRSCARVCQVRACIQPYQAPPIYNAASRPPLPVSSGLIPRFHFSPLYPSFIMQGRCLIALVILASGAQRGSITTR